MSDKVVFIDSIGRTILGEENSSKSTKTSLAVDDPSIVFVQPNPENGQIQVQVIPLYFKELVAEKARKGKVTWLFNRSTIIPNSNLEIDDKLHQQYERVTSIDENPPGIVTSDDASEPEVVKLFDDDDESK
jgi:hypothetical protein